MDRSRSVVTLCARQARLTSQGVYSHASMIRTYKSHEARASDHDATESTGLGQLRSAPRRLLFAHLLSSDRMLESNKHLTLAAACFMLHGIVLLPNYPHHFGPPDSSRSRRGMGRVPEELALQMTSAPMNPSQLRLPTP